MSDTKTTSRNFWDTLTGPHAAITGIIEQRRIRIPKGA